MKSYVSISFSDLMLVEEFMDAWSSNNKSKMNKIFFQYGIDIKHPEGVEEQVCTHRNLRGQVVTCVRFVGVERQDKEWLRSGMASMEAHYASAEPSLRKEMSRMARQYNNVAHVTGDKAPSNIGEE